MSLRVETGPIKGGGTHPVMSRWGKKDSRNSIFSRGEIEPSPSSSELVRSGAEEAGLHRAGKEKDLPLKMCRRRGATFRKDRNALGNGGGQIHRGGEKSPYKGLEKGGRF